MGNWFSRGLRWLCYGRRGDMIDIDDTQHKDETIMRLMTPEDAQQVHAILTTHAEMQDNHARQSMEVLGRLNVEIPDEGEMIDDLVAMIEVAEEDSENLKRLARIFKDED